MELERISGSAEVTGGGGGTVVGRGGSVGDWRLSCGDDTVVGIWPGEEVEDFGGGGETEESS